MKIQNNAKKQMQYEKKKFNAKEKAKEKTISQLVEETKEEIEKGRQLTLNFHFYNELKGGDE